MRSKIAIIELGTNNLDFLTIKALKAIERAKKVIIKGRVDKKIKEILNKKAKIWFTEDDQDCSSLLIGNVLLITLNEVYDLPEVAFLKANGSLFQIIPTVKPFLAFPAINKIPVTRRGVNLGFMVVKEKIEYGSLVNYINITSQTRASLLICNNFSFLEEITQLFIIKGMGDMPIAIFDFLQNESQWTTSSMELVQESICTKKISNSAIILIGDVVRRHQESGYREIEELVFSKI